MGSVQEFCDTTTAGITRYFHHALGLRVVPPKVMGQVKQAYGGYDGIWACPRRIAAPRTFTLVVELGNLDDVNAISRSANADPSPLSAAAGIGESRVRVAPASRGRYALEIPLPDDFWEDVPMKHLPQRKGFRVTVGVDSVEKRPVYIDLANELTKHWRFIGKTGSGKSTLMQVIGRNVALNNPPTKARLILIDVASELQTWGPFANSSHLAHDIVTDIHTARLVLARVLVEIDRRMKLSKADIRSLPRWIVAIDELKVLIKDEDCKEAITYIVEQGRKVNVQLQIATQHASLEYLGTMAIKANTVAVCGSVDNANIAYNATGHKKSGAEALTAAGDLVLVGNGRPTRFTAALPDEADFAMLPQTDTVDALDLPEDPERVRNVVRRDGFDVTPEMVATALCHQDTGINKLGSIYREHFGSVNDHAIGAARSFAREVRAAMDELGCQGGV